MEHERTIPGYPGPKFPGTPSPAQEERDAAAAATQRRLAREEEFVRTGQVAGHDFPAEEAERLRGRGRGR